MQATETDLLTFMQGAKQYIIPIYQRTYSWTLVQCQQLWDDIVRVAEDSNIPAHFIGSIVYISDGIYHSSSVTRLLVIDGQQRLTTISLFLIALCEAVKGSLESSVTATKLRNYYLVNNDEEGEDRHKLLLTRSDRDTLLALVDANYPAPAPESQRVRENFQFFRERISQSNLTVDSIYHGLKKLIIVDVSLDGDHDNPQLIFESLNSTGLDLSQSDLIRNYILMGLKPEHQTRLYNRFWYPIESHFSQSDEESRFDFFMRDFLTLKNNGQIPTLRDVYRTFKQYMRVSGLTIDELVKDVFNHAMIYARFVSPEIEDDSGIRNTLADIKTLKMDVVYTFLLEVFLDHKKELISRDALLEILKIVESYVFRRAIVGIPTNSMNKTFATLSRSLDKARYLDSVKAAFLLLDSYRRFPDDDEFVLELVQKDVYNFRSRTYLLDKFENYERKERVNTSEYTIEHIMPQNPALSPEWQRMLGDSWKDVQSRHVHTIGNLTLTGYNSELSDRPFQEKRDMPGGFHDSPIRLNSGLRSLEVWNVAAIEARAWQLAERAKKIWAYPALPTAVLDSFRNTTIEEPEAYSLDHFKMKGIARELFDHLRKRIINLDPIVREEPKKLYIAYKTTTNFVDIVPQQSRLILTLNMSFAALKDPRGLGQNVAGRSHWGNGEVEISFQDLGQIDDVMDLIRQSFDYHDEL